MVNSEKTTAGRGPGRRGGIGEVQRDFVALGIAIASIVLFVGTGGAVVPRALQSLAGYGVGPDKVLVNALLLNIALIIFGWRRYRQLVEEIEERRKAEEHARVLAETDPLTGFFNRRSIADAADELIARTASRGGAVALMMIDLDNFKPVNDLNGHSAGDEILKEVARRIAAQLPEGARLARLGGDEFAAVMAFDPARSEAVDQIAAEVVEVIAQPVAVGEAQVRVSASLGIARSDLRIHESAPIDAPSLLHMADIAMYRAKNRGRNGYFWFEGDMESELRFRNEIESGVRRGIELGEFVPFYEQQIDLATGELTGFEMLARWRSPILGLVNPDVFIPVAEEIGVIGELSECIIAQALEDAKCWDPRLTLSVNISPLQLRDPWFAQKLLRLLVQASFPPQRLEIELTEVCLRENVGAVRSLVSSLRNQGIRLSLDDFGMGYNSLAEIRSLPFDRIKIDHSFVIGLAESNDSAAIVDAVARLGAGLGLPITAEGVQTKEVLEELRRYGAMRGQGYLFGKPQPASETREWLQSRGLLASPAPAPEDAGAGSRKQARLRPLAGNA